MNDRILLLALPSAVVFGVLVFHSFRTLARGRAAAFWVAALAYGVVRGVAVRLVTQQGLHSSVPYVFHARGPSVFGVVLQEICGWAIVVYLGWWFGCRLARVTRAPHRATLFVQVAWACVFLAAACWAVETAAAAAGWWHWTIPASHEMLGPVPGIGVVDWTFVGIDFLLPFLAWTAPALRTSRWRWLTLAAFPLHFAAHLAPTSSAGAVLFAAVHGGEILAVIGLALFSRIPDDAFAKEGRQLDWIPTTAIGVMVAALTIAIAWVGKRPDLLVAITPLIGATLHTRRAWLCSTTGGMFVGLALIDPRFLFAAALATTAVALGWAARGSRARSVAFVAVAALAIFAMPLTIARNEARLRDGLDQAIAARDRGDLVAAQRWLTHLAYAGPRSHVPLALLGEIRYRTRDVEGSRAAFAEAISIQPRFVAGYRHLAVIELQQGRPPVALDYARRGLLVAPEDLELGYLEQRAQGSVTPEYWQRVLEEGPQDASGIAALAFEVGDAAGAAELVDRALARWPNSASLGAQRSRLSAATDQRGSVPAASR